jgi:hypothetical protein
LELYALAGMCGAVVMVEIVGRERGGGGENRPIFKWTEAVIRSLGLRKTGKS